ncbi:hypothetical protein BCR34DRAFT_633854 [Clohesyomyces aquaticus]|uniref:Uncharacterized protein n=1 Tax=Clohesyomyces aquaticus TaxID=1231657 RepID=A0A1Y1Z309_9PLEO|nr:hypothetical protein BCR34DRAFT_633854 [Clohesyomyces aquaticus]
MFGIFPTTLSLYGSTKNSLWMWLLGIFGCPALPLLEFCLIAVAGGLFALEFLAYSVLLIRTGFKSFSRGCFLMPCAPQSILDWDQAYSLVVGIVLLIGVECVPAVLKYRNDAKAFEEDVRGKIADGLQERRARSAHKASINTKSGRTMDDGDIELGNLAKDIDEPDETLPFATDDQVTPGSVSNDFEDFGIYESGEASTSTLNVPLGEGYMM